ncbi:MAG: FKBP-type peptidyl-prolyl cis-trans isomerase [Candidatus Absconditabacteria bacterium]|nr:FKBP-type peptidyl-prolyl cis-trans isomerase [Candidatus Absconditabacteria bacterium]
MKKYLLIGVVTLSLALAGCNQTSNPEEEQSTPISENTNQEETLSLNSPEMCANVIKDYLAKADLKGKGTKKVEKGHEIVVHYVGRLNDTEVFDTSVEEVAKACGKHHPARNYNEGLAFKVGAGQMIAGFDKGVEGMKVGQTKTITIPAKEAYGEWSESNIVEIELSNLPEGNYEKGMKLYSEMGQTFTVHEVKEKTVMLDSNHELAGKDLIFDITLVEIK